MHVACCVCAQDNSSVLNVPYWSDNSTEVFSLTFVSGPCNFRNAESYPWADSLQRFPSIPGCNLRTATNKNLAQVLLRDAANATSQPLLLRVVANVTLGPGINQSIPIRRPVVLLGMVSAPTSVDLGMVVNQLNVTLPFGKITWQSLVLENLAPGKITFVCGQILCVGGHGCRQSIAQPAAA
jgi:hypothetical protein